MTFPLEYLKAGNYKNRRVPSTSLPGTYDVPAFQIHRRRAAQAHSCRLGKTTFRKKGWEQGEEKVEV